MCFSGGMWDASLWGADSLVVHTGLAALQHVGSWFPNQGSNLHHLPCKADA